MTYLILLAIYLISLIGMWCFYHFFNPEPNPGIKDISFTIVPGLNSIFLVLAFIVLMSELDWNSIGKKFFLINK